jgi:hypothetical protein
MVDHRGKVAELTTTAGSWLHLFRRYWQAAERDGRERDLLENNLDTLRDLAPEHEGIAKALRMAEERS